MLFSATMINKSRCSIGRTCGRGQRVDGAHEGILSCQWRVRTPSIWTPQHFFYELIFYFSVCVVDSRRRIWRARCVRFYASAAIEWCHRLWPLCRLSSGGILPFAVLYIDASNVETNVLVAAILDGDQDASFKIQCTPAPCIFHAVDWHGSTRQERAKATNSCVVEIWRLCCWK